MKVLLLSFAFASTFALAAHEPASAARFRLLGEALHQAERMSGQWDPGQRDCAGFVRYLYRKSIPGKEPLWRDRSGAPALFLTADELLAYNFEPLGKLTGKDDLETGDVLAFHLAHKGPAEAYHLMVVLEPPGMATDRTLVVYHNGASGKDGQVRKAWIDDLKEGPPEWRPTASNRAFLGAFRWRGWTQRFPRGR